MPGAAFISCSMKSKPGVEESTTTLIPRDVIFGNPERAGADISPDGKYMSFLAPHDGVLNVYVVERGKDLSEARHVTNEKVRPLRRYYWSPSSEEILYVQDNGGDENFLLHAVNIETGVERKLTDFEGVRVFLYRSSWSRPDELLIGINDRDKSWHDPYILNIKTGELTRVFENNDQFDGIYADEHFNIRFVTRATEDGGQEVLRYDHGKTELFTKIGFEDSLTTGPAGLSADGKTLFMIESRERNTSALVAIDLVTGTTTVIGADERADIGGIISDPVTDKVLAYSVNYLKNEWTAVDSSVEADPKFLNENLKGEWGVQGQTRDNTIWIIGNDPVTEPARTLIYDRTAQSLSEFYVGRPALIGAPLPEVYPLELKSRDGLTLVSYLTLPKGSDLDGNGIPDQPLPMVLNVHGGPWTRDGYGYHPESVWLSNRGYATLQVNYRGSSGFGKNFINAGDREWGGKMHDDLLDAVNWAVKRGVTTADKVAIYGGSYGGYATMVGMTFTPETFACGVNIVGVTNLNTFMNTIPAYWDSFREQMYRRVGDPRTEEGRAFLASRSPVNKAGEIKRPLLIAQGANDPRVNKDESDQMVQAMKEKHIPVTYVLYPDEGHGFARPANRLSFYAIAEAFLSECLGGHFEPAGDDFKDSSLKVVTGIENVPGLKDALGVTSSD
jgi:dipeptidyl aminopeptidase/acylaminoacyl peptidase